MQKGVQKIAEPKENQLIWFYKNPDDNKSGILFGTVVSKEDSVYIIRLSGGDEVRRPPKRLFLIFGQEYSIPYLLRDDSLEKKKLERDVESSPGPRYLIY